MKVKHWQDWLILAAALWLYVSPFLLGSATLANSATVLSWVCAVVLMISAAEALTFPDVIEEWVDVVAGLALVAGPWLFGFGNQALPTANSVAVGVFVIGVAASALVRERRAARSRSLAGSG